MAFTMKTINTLYLRFARKSVMNQEYAPRVAPLCYKKRPADYCPSAKKRPADCSARRFIKGYAIASTKLIRLEQGQQ